jgi:hypothetical protein
LALWLDAAQRTHPRHLKRFLRACAYCKKAELPIMRKRSYVCQRIHFGFQGNGSAMFALPPNRFRTR